MPFSSLAGVKWVFFFLVRCVVASYDGRVTDCDVIILQVYPTIVRSIGLGCCSTMARVGAALTPYIAQVRAFTCPIPTTA